MFHRYVNVYQMVSTKQKNYSTPLKKMKVSWDDDIPNIWEKMFQTTNQIKYSVYRKLWFISSNL